MTPESADSITLRIWDRSTVERTLENAVQQLAERTRTSKHSIVVTRSGPNTYTASLDPDSLTANENRPATPAATA
ncbi:hypothetical protein DBZ45_10895 [Arthrobacter globiformis]|uniref:Uncharacterized protein n=1 Tax=Arthrobacter globiformis TaxID=1665 RepID=A0A328HFN3_ARTGO|nr:hypothetical protein DBZ45_10895 [Arthrobacter globiformis]